MTSPKGSGLDKLLLPSWCRIAGIVLVIIGLVFTWLHFVMGIKPGFLDVRVFALHSEYFDVKNLMVISNNISEEICGILLFTGLFFIAFGREKREREEFWQIRLKAFLLAFYISSSIMIISFLFLYGLGFIKLVFLNIYIPLTLYIVFFRYGLYRIKNINPS